MNRDKLLKQKEKVVADLELYDACSEIFHLLRDNQIKCITLKSLTVNEKQIRRKLTYTDHEGEWHSWTTIATQRRDGTVSKPLGLHLDTEKDFVEAYHNTYREMLRERVFERNGKIVEVVDQPKTR